MGAGSVWSTGAGVVAGRLEVASDALWYLGTYGASSLSRLSSGS